MQPWQGTCKTLSQEDGKRKEEENKWISQQSSPAREAGEAGRDRPAAGLERQGRHLLNQLPRLQGHDHAPAANALGEGVDEAVCLKREDAGPGWSHADRGRFLFQGDREPTLR